MSNRTFKTFIYSTGKSKRHPIKATLGEWRNYSYYGDLKLKSAIDEFNLPKKKTWGEKRWGI